MIPTLLSAIRRHSIIVADTAEFLDLAKYEPQDATTNPSLILRAVGNERYRDTVRGVCERCGSLPLEEISDRLLVRFGTQILNLIPGRVSTEIDARLSFDVDATVKRAHRVIELYHEAGVAPARVLIKIAATWEGIQAARRLEAQGVHCNLTLVFGLAQATACADAGAKLISPFVGRIYDWHKQRAGTGWDEAAHAGEHDPGVQSVRAIHAYFQQHGITTEVMAASFRNTGQVLALAGCDLLTVSPTILDELAHTLGEVPRRLAPRAPCLESSVCPPMLQEQFEAAMSADTMAREKLAEGVRAFCDDAGRLDIVLTEKMRTGW